MYRVGVRVRVTRPHSGAGTAAKRGANHSSIRRSEPHRGSTVLSKDAGHAVRQNGTRRDVLCGESDSTRKSSASLGPYVETIRLSRRNSFSIDWRV